MTEARALQKWYWMEEGMDKYTHLPEYSEAYVTYKDVEQALTEEHQRRLETVAMCEQLKQELNAACTQLELHQRESQNRLARLVKCEQRLETVRAEERKKVFLEVAQKCNPNGLGPENRSWHALNGWAFIEDWCRQNAQEK